MAKRDSKKAARIRDDISKWDNYWRLNNEHYHEMTMFIMGEQWTKDQASVFTDYKKIPMTVNKIATLMNHLVGEQIQNTPNLQIEPADNVPEELVEIREALVKEICLSSDAKTIYQTVFLQACVGGYSAYRIGTEYESNKSFNEKINMSSFNDPTKCYWSLDAESICKTDGLCAGFRTIMSRKKFRQLWGKDLERKIGIVTAEVTNPFDSVGFLAFSDEDSITIIHDFRRKSKTRTIYALSDGSTVNDEEFDALDSIDIESENDDEDSTQMLIKDGMPVTILNSRTFTEYTIIHSQWAGDYQLESEEFPSQQLPIIFCDQKSFYDKNGKQITGSFFKHAKDSQIYLNYLRTQMAYLIKISRYDQFMAPRGCLASNDTAAIWRDPATVQGALVYDEIESREKPERLTPPELPQSLLLQYQEASNDIQVTCGMFDTQIGQQGNEISGEAIDARNDRGSFNTSSPRNALNIAIACGGSIINEMIPKIYDTERNVSLDLKNSGREKVTLNQPVDEYGTQIKNDMSLGDFKIRLLPGPSYEKQKQEGLQAFASMFAFDQTLIHSFGDLYADNFSIPNAIEIRNRFRSMIPPELIEAGKTGQPIPPKPPQQDPMIMLKQKELQMKQQQMQMDFQVKQQELQMKENELMAKSHMAGADYSKELAKLESEKQQNQAKMRESEMRFEAEMRRISADQHTNHTQNVVKILTHQPNHFKQQSTNQGSMNE